MKTPVILRVYKNSQLIEVKQFDQDQIVVGHDADVQLDLDHESVSPIHCLIERREDTFYTCDLGSKTGTFKNGQAILDEPLSSGDEIQIGPFKIAFFVGVPKPRSAPGAVASQKESPARIPEAPVEQKTEPVNSARGSTNPESIKPVVKKNEEPTVKSSLPLKNIQKPEIKPVASSKTATRKKKTFAPGNQIADLSTFFRPTKGNNVEVSVAWQGRIINSMHFRKSGIIKADDLDLPQGTVSRSQTLIENRNGVKVFVASDMTCEIVSQNQKLDLEQAISQNKATRGSSGCIVRLEQSEVIYLTFASGSIQLIIRNVPLTPVIPLLPPLLMSSEEMTGLILSLVLVALLGFTISATKPPEEPEKVEDITRVAQVVFTNPPDRPKPPEVKTQQPPPPPPAVKPPPPPPEKVQAADKKTEAQKKGQSTSQKAQPTQLAQKATEVAPIPNSKNKPKKFTSIKQGGAVKIGQKAGANAQSAKDVTKMGLFSAFGGNGIRKKIDEAYSGAGEMLGNADKATGQSGMGENRSGDDLGSRFKDTGAGGKGTATQGISGIGTKGRATGMSAYGSTEGFGDKTNVNIEPGGAEEDFVGTIDKDAVRRTVIHNLNQVRGCFVRELSKLDLAGRNKLEGKVVVTWDIVAKGLPKNVRVKSSTLNNSIVENCIRERLATWIFPEPPVGMTAEISYPFYLRPGN